MNNTELIERLKQTDQFYPNADVCTSDVVGAIESLQAEVERLKVAAKYAEHIDATPENQRETMLHDALTERNALRAQIASARRDALEEAANVIVGTYAGITAVMCSNLVRKLKDET